MPISPSQSMAALAGEVIELEAPLGRRLVECGAAELVGIRRVSAGE
jgi:hypothetical protein